MLLRTLGELSLTGARLSRPKPLLLLAYLSLEGQKTRSYLSELFWPQAASPRQSLTVALSQIRRSAPGAVDFDGARIRTTVDCDASILLEAAARRSWPEVLSLYTGSFLEGIRPDGIGVELEEWIFGTREYLSLRIQESLISAAEAAATRGDVMVTLRLAERAFALRAEASSIDDSMLERLHALLTLGGSPRAQELQEEAELSGIVLAASGDFAKGQHYSDQEEPAGTTHNLPSYSTPIVGRELALKELTQLLGGFRLITVCGIGGMGKTRLALELARVSLEQGLVDRSCFVPLNDVDAAGEILERVATALEVAIEPLELPVQAIARSTGGMKLLLVLDNFEHLVAGARVALDLLESCPGFSVVVTSREPLGLIEEQLFMLEGLTLLDGAYESLGDAERSGAVRLFLQRARQIDRRFDLNTDNFVAVVEICRLVGSAPLGIELAAGLLRSLSPQEVLADMESDLDTLRGDERNRPERHVSLRSVFEQTWRVLPAQQRDVLKRFAVFRHGAARAAAAEVAGANIPLLTALTGKSLVRRFGRRFGLHPLVGTFVSEKLALEPELETEVRRQHAQYYAGLLKGLGIRLQDAGFEPALREIAGEVENARYAWAWAVALERWDLVNDLLPALDRFHRARGLFRDFVELVEAALQRIEPEIPACSPVWSNLSLSRLRHLRDARRNGELVSIADSELPVHRRISDKGTIANILLVLGVALARLQESRRAIACWREALPLARASGESEAVVRLLNDLSATSVDSIEAERLSVESLEAARHLADPAILAKQLFRRAFQLSWFQGNYAEAEGLATEAADVAASGDDLDDLGEVRVEVLRASGKLDQADAAIQEAERSLGDVLAESKLEACRRDISHHRARMLYFRGESASGIELVEAELGDSPNPNDTLLLARLALEAGDAPRAQAIIADCQRAAMTLPTGRLKLLAITVTNLLATEVALATGRTQQARALLVETLDGACRQRFLPSVLEGILVASSFQGNSRAVELLTVAATHSLARYETRFRASARLGSTSGDVRLPTDQELLDFAARVLD